MAESMIARMAEAIGNGVYRELGCPSDWCPADGAMEIVAREVLAAMRQPGTWMVDEMCGAWARNNQEKLGVLMLRYWEAAIDAALVDDPGNPETQEMIDAALSEPTT